MVYLLLVFGFDIVEPTEVNIRYTFYICNNINDFDSWTSGKVYVFGTPLIKFNLDFIHVKVMRKGHLKLPL
jgi:hypothetical protein